MQIVQSLKDFQIKGNGCWITIGKWDGIHLGHQRILKELVANARRNGGLSVVISFDRHPDALFRPTSVPYQLQTVIERSTVLGELGVDVHLVIPFTTQFASLSPTQFVEDILINGLHASEIMVGYNFRFGRGQQGTIELLKEICFSFDVAVKVFSPVIIDGEVISSTKIRHYLERGEVEKVKKFLGRPPVIFGQIMRGTKITKKGECTFPLVVDRAKQVPASGEYEVEVDVGTSLYSGTLVVKKKDLQNTFWLNVSGDLPIFWKKSVWIKLISQRKDNRLWREEVN